MAVSVESFSFSRAAQPEAEGPSSMLNDGFLYCILSATSLDPNSLGGPEVPFGLVWLSLPLLDSNSNCLTSVLTELYNSSTSTQSHTQSFEWHVWSSSSEITVMQFTGHSLPIHHSVVAQWGLHLVPYYQPSSPARFLSINGHWNASLPLSLNGMFARAEGQNTTLKK